MSELPADGHHCLTARIPHPSGTVSECGNVLNVLRLRVCVCVSVMRCQIFQYPCGPFYDGSDAKMDFVSCQWYQERSV